MNLIKPFKTEVDFLTGGLTPQRNIMQRRLSDMKLMVADSAEAARILAEEGDRLIYEVQGVELPDEEGQIPHCTTRILPGRIARSISARTILSSFRYGQRKPGTIERDDFRKLVLLRDGQPQLVDNPKYS